MINTDATSAIAYIERHRRDMEKEGGADMARNEALRRLHELLEREHGALQASGTSGGHAANVEAVTVEIERVKRLAGVVGKGVMPKHGRPQAQKHVGPSRAHNAPRNKGRRTMGRTSGR
jgi:hypothetical protein